MVGAVDNQGTPLDIVQYMPNPAYPGSRVDVWAPGAQQTCPDQGGAASLFTTATSGGESFPSLVPRITMLVR